MGPEENDILEVQQDVVKSTSSTYIVHPLDRNCPSAKYLIDTFSHSSLLYKCRYGHFVTAPIGQNRSRRPASWPTCILTVSNEEGDENEISEIDPRSSSLVDARLKLRCFQRRSLERMRGWIENDECIVSTVEVMKKMQRPFSQYSRKSPKFLDECVRVRVTKDARLIGWNEVFQLSQAEPSVK